MSANLAFVFPGQGSQALGMLAEQGAEHALIIETFAEASAALGYDLWSLTQQGPQEQLNQTDKTQPAILAASIALTMPARFGASVVTTMATDRPTSQRQS